MAWNKGIIFLRSPGGYSTDVWVGRCGWDTQTLTLFKTEISDFPTLFKTEISDFPTLFKTASRFLRPRLNTFNQKSLPSFVVAQASGISANKKGTNSAFCTIFTNCTLFLLKCKDTLFKTKSHEIDTPFKTKKAENHTLSGRASPLRPYQGVPPPPPRASFQSS